MSNRTDWEHVAEEIVQAWPSNDMRNYRALRDRIETELHNAYVAGQEGSPEVWAQFQAAPEVHINRIEVREDDPDLERAIGAALARYRNRIEVREDDPDRLAFGIVDAFTKKVTGEMMIPTDFGPLTITSDPMMRPGEIRMVNVTLDQPGTVTFAGDPQARPVGPLGGPPGGPGEIDGLTPEQCRDRWEANAAAIESGMARPYALSPDQIAEGKRLHLAALKAGR